MKQKNMLALLISALFVSQTDAQTGTFTEHHDIKCSDTLALGGLGYPTWNDPEILRPATYGNSVLLGDFVPANILEYIAPPSFEGADTVVIKCAHATQITCDTGIYIFHVTCAEVAPKVEVFEKNRCGDTLLFEGLNGFLGPVIAEEPKHGKAEILLYPTDGAALRYVSEDGFTGTDWVVVDYLHPNLESILLVYHVDCQPVGSPEIFSPLELGIFPNPADEFVLVFSKDEILEEARIFDALGREHFPAYSERYFSGIRLGIGHLLPGNYLVLGKSAGQLKIGKFIVSRN